MKSLNQKIAVIALILLSFTAVINAETIYLNNNLHIQIERKARRTWQAKNIVSPSSYNRKFGLAFFFQ